MTLQQRYAKYLQAQGYTRKLDTLVSKYWVYNKGDMSDTYFLGKSGAVRFSKTGKVTDSFSLNMTDTFKQRMLQWEKDNELQH